jgi:hypothetical protein
MTLKDYWKDLIENDPKKKFKQRVISELGITVHTFNKYVQGKTKGVNKLFKERIAEIAGKPVDELFPE